MRPEEADSLLKEAATGRRPARLNALLAQAGPEKDATLLGSFLGERLVSRIASFRPGLSASFGGSSRAGGSPVAAGKKPARMSAISEGVSVADTSRKPSRMNSGASFVSAISSVLSGPSTGRYGGAPAVTLGQRERRKTASYKPKAWALPGSSLFSMRRLRDKPPVPVVDRVAMNAPAAEPSAHGKKKRHRVGRLGGPGGSSSDVSLSGAEEAASPTRKLSLLHVARTHMRTREDAIIREVGKHTRKRGAAVLHLVRKAGEPIPPRPVPPPWRRKSFLSAIELEQIAEERARAQALGAAQLATAAADSARQRDPSPTRAHPASKTGTSNEGSVSGGTAATAAAAGSGQGAPTADAEEVDVGGIALQATSDVPPLIPGGIAPSRIPMLRRSGSDMWTRPHPDVANPNQPRRRRLSAGNAGHAGREPASGEVSEALSGIERGGAAVHDDAAARRVSVVMAANKGGRIHMDRLLPEPPKARTASAAHDTKHRHFASLLPFLGNGGQGDQPANLGHAGVQSSPLRQRRLSAGHSVHTVGVTVSGETGEGHSGETAQQDVSASDHNVRQRRVAVVVTTSKGERIRVERVVPDQPKSQVVTATHETGRRHLAGLLPFLGGGHSDHPPGASERTPPHAAASSAHVVRPRSPSTPPEHGSDAVGDGLETHPAPSQPPGRVKVLLADFVRMGEPPRMPFNPSALVRGSASPEAARAEHEPSPDAAAGRAVGGAKTLLTGRPGGHRGPVVGPPPRLWGAKRFIVLETTTHHDHAPAAGARAGEHGDEGPEEGAGHSAKPGRNQAGVLRGRHHARAKREEGATRHHPAPITDHRPAGADGWRRGMHHTPEEPHAEKEAK